MTATTSDEPGKTPAAGAISRIVVTFAGAEGAPALVEAALLTARVLGADLHGLYIREQALSDLAALPFSAVVGPGGASAGAVTADTVERAWRREEMRCRRVLERARGRTGWTFDTVAGEFESCLCSVATRRDLIVLAGHPAEMTAHHLVAAVRAAARTAGAVMVSGVEARAAAAPFAPTAQAPGPVLAIDDGDALAGTALALAGRLARATGRRLAVLTVPGAGGARPDPGKHDEAGLVGQPYDLHHLPFWTGRSLAAAVDRIAPSLAVADLQSPGLSRTALADQFLRTIRVPLILLGGREHDKVA